MTPAEFDAIHHYEDGWRYELVHGVLVVNPIPQATRGVRMMQGSDQNRQLVAAFGMGEDASTHEQAVPQKTHAGKLGRFCGLIMPIFPHNGV